MSLLPMHYNQYDRDWCLYRRTNADGYWNFFLLKVIENISPFSPRILNIYYKIIECKSKS